MPVTKSMQSTAGPWFWKPGHTYRAVIYAESPGDDIQQGPRRTAICEPNRPKSFEGNANAILIAASPELRDALEGLVGMVADLSCTCCAEETQLRDAKVLLTRLESTT